MSPERREIHVVADWSMLGGAREVGVLTATPHRRKEVFAFEYHETWLADPAAQLLDPALALYRGPQYASPEASNFGVFLDSSPDRWGRVLMTRREAYRARSEDRRPRALLESDYLLGVFDGHRLGGLRFKTTPDGAYLDDDIELASPPWTSLRELEQASLRLEEAGSEEDPSYGRWLNMLLAPGRSLGGARPKASVLDPAGDLWIAKFPSRHDDFDVGAWEGVVHTLATRAGLLTSEAQARRFGGRHHTFLTRRFDRDGAARRHFASAMTMLRRRDGDHGSYLELGEVLAQRGAQPARDLEQLWRRIAFFVCVSNVDDHLRNHGFLLDSDGWSLAPAYDMNPLPWGDGLSLDILDGDNSLDLELVRDAAPHFRLDQDRATAVLAEVLAAVRTWPEVASRAGLSRAEQQTMEPAFGAAAR